MRAREGAKEGWREKGVQLRTPVIGSVVQEP